jgi:phosphoglycerol transferase MdoB-like AlkP superfamily enzyme
MMSQFWIDLIGWIGAISVLIAYLMVSTRRWQGHSTRYQVLNLLGGVCLILNTLYFRAYPSSLVNLVWVGIAVFTLIKGRNKVDL